jgi:hypothetical protein
MASKRISQTIRQRKKKVKQQKAKARYKKFMIYDQTTSHRSIQRMQTMGNTPKEYYLSELVLDYYRTLRAYWIIKYNNEKRCFKEIRENKSYRFILPLEIIFVILEYGNSQTYYETEEFIVEKYVIGRLGRYYQSSLLLELSEELRKRFRSMKGINF